MFSDLSLLQVYGAMARHAAETQRVSADNLSRAGEPGFKASEVESFQDYLQRVASSASPEAMTETFKIRNADTPAAPNGNTVSLEHEVFTSAQATGQHNMALTVYQKSLDMLRMSLGRRN